MPPRLPTNLPGTSISNPDRPNTVYCPRCHRPFEVYKLSRNTVTCPYCGHQFYASAITHS